MKHIAFAKIGKSIKFFPSKYSPSGGDNEPSATLMALANNNPGVTYYIVGRSDFQKLSGNDRLRLFPYGNVVDIWEGAPHKTFKERKNYDDPFYHHINTYFVSNNIELDCAIIMFGQVGTVTIPGKIEQVRDRSLIASVIDMTLNYTTPISVWLSETKIPFVEIINDPRYTCAQARDMYHMPAGSLSQYNYTYTHNPIKSLEDQDRELVLVEPRYAGMETSFCVGKTKPDLAAIYKSERFNIVLNEGSPSRYDMLNEWVLSHFEDGSVSVYGRWENKLAQPDVDSRFKGSLKIDELQERMKSTKYTFIIPIAPGWVTSKYLEMIHIGVIPFFHPSYDTQLHIDVPSLLRPETPEQLYKTMSYLDENENIRIKILKSLQASVLKSGLYDGSILANTIMNECADVLGRRYVRPDVSTFTKSEVTDLSDFF